MSTSSLVRRVPVVLLALTGLQLGVWIQLAPRHFFDEFPGAGHRWVAAFGPYNEHLLRDFGAMNLALGVIALVATVRFDRTLVRVACGAWFLFGVQHLAFHSMHVDMLDGVDRWGSVGALVLVLVFAAAGWFLAPPRAGAVADPARARAAGATDPADGLPSVAPTPPPRA